MPRQLFTDDYRNKFKTCQVFLSIYGGVVTVSLYKQPATKLIALYLNQPQARR